MVRSYKDLTVYQSGYQLALKVHPITLAFPKHELHELGSQMRRAAVSIPLNIAEGYGRKLHVKDYQNFLSHALGSTNEMAVLLDMAKDLGYISKEEHQELQEGYDHLGRQLNALIQRMEDANAK